MYLLDEEIQKIPEMAEVNSSLAVTADSLLMRVLPSKESSLVD